MTLSIGQRVVCIRTATEPQREAWRPHAGKFPRVGTIYHIRSIAFDNPQQPDGLVTVREIDNSHLMNRLRKEPGFPVYAFRPIVERPADISFAHEILRKASKKAPALIPSADRCRT